MRNPQFARHFLDRRGPIAGQDFDRIALARQARDDFARVVSFLASAESGWINGQVVKANGGRN
jgi:NAD(P)-dependent dehydrogenase (short-subunit alcohol dehydrogenase family)